MSMELEFRKRAVKAAARKLIERKSRPRAGRAARA